MVSSPRRGTGATLPYQGSCDALAGRQTELGGKVICSILEESRQAEQIYRYGVFATGDLGGWLLVAEGQQYGWNVVDATTTEGRPNW